VEAAQGAVSAQFKSFKMFKTFKSLQFQFTAGKNLVASMTHALGFRASYWDLYGLNDWNDWNILNHRL
jgi:hypothetical protein